MNNTIECPLCEKNKRSYEAVREHIKIEHEGSFLDNEYNYTNDSGCQFECIVLQLEAV